MTTSQNTPAPKIFRRTWQGRPGTLTMYGNAPSVRVTVFQWADEPDTVEIKVIRGDGRTDDFARLWHKTVTADEVGATLAMALAVRNGY